MNISLTFVFLVAPATNEGSEGSLWSSSVCFAEGETAELLDRTAHLEAAAEEHREREEGRAVLNDKKNSRPLWTALEEALRVQLREQAAAHAEGQPEAEAPTQQRKEVFVQKPRGKALKSTGLGALSPYGTKWPPYT
jgi:hypothetical protein